MHQNRYFSNPTTFTVPATSQHMGLNPQDGTQMRTCICTYGRYNCKHGAFETQMGFFCFCFLCGMFSSGKLSCLVVTKGGKWVKSWFERNCKILNLLVDYQKTSNLIINNICNIVHSDCERKCRLSFILLFDYSLVQLC